MSKLTIAKRIEMLEAIAQDEGVKMTQRLRAFEEIGRLEARAAAAAGASVGDEERVVAPDPMADLDEVEAQRQKRARRHIGTLIARRR